VDLVFTSNLALCLRSQLEDLFFFNAKQKLYLPEIEESIQVLGAPKIKENRDRLAIHLPKSPAAQCLFCLERSTEKLFAAMVYFRSEYSELEVFHMAISKHLLPGQHSLQLFLSCINCLKKIAKQINGVEWLVLPYGRGKIKI
jgi:hypothetical protein